MTFLRDMSWVSAGYISAGTLGFAEGRTFNGEDLIAVGLIMLVGIGITSLVVRRWFA